VAEQMNKPKETAWERFERLTRKIVQVPKEAIQKPKREKPQ